MGAQLFRELCDYIGFGEDDWGVLRDLHPAAEPHFGEIVDEFYDRLQQFPAASRVFASDVQVERLKVSLRGWLDRLLSGPWDQDYFELRSKIGRMHVRVELPQRYMFTAMALIRLHLLEVASEAYDGDAARLMATMRSLSRVLDLELAIMLQTYREDSLSNLRRFEALEKERLERRLEISEERYHAIVESAAAVVILVDESFQIQVFNSAAEQVTGYRATELAGGNCVDKLCHPVDAHEMRARLTASVAGEHTPAFESRLVRRDGETRWMRWHLTPLATQGKHEACAIGVDVTEERKLAEKGRRAESLAALGALAAGLAHEIRNPLNAAQLQLTLLGRRIDKNPEKARESAKLVSEELRRLAGLLEDFLSFARPSKLRIVPADVCATVRVLAELLEPDAAEHGASLELALPDAPVAIRFDEERVKQVLINLIRNGFEAASDGGTVTVSVERISDSVRIEVRDTGAGISNDVEIFEPFRTTKESGTGLGLSIVHRIVTDHSGTISADRLNDETVFAIDLPVDGPDS